jgi:hypothetical protein
MYTIGANSAVAGSELLWILSITESVFLFLILYWQFLFASEDFNLFSMAAPVLPALIGEVHQWFARRHGLLKFFRFWIRANHHYFLPPVHSADFLLLRDGLPRAGFFRTPARSDIPPPCPA